MPNLLADSYFLQNTDDHPHHCDVIVNTKENVGGCQPRIVYRNVVSILGFFRYFLRPVSRIKPGHLMRDHVTWRGFRAPAASERKDSRKISSYANTLKICFNVQVSRIK
jgi:hypothetical protein